MAGCLKQNLQIKPWTKWESLINFVLNKSLPMRTSNSTVMWNCRYASHTIVLCYFISKKIEEIFSFPGILARKAPLVLLFITLRRVGQTVIIWLLVYRSDSACTSVFATAPQMFWTVSLGTTDSLSRHDTGTASRCRAHICYPESDISRLLHDWIFVWNLMQFPAWRRVKKRTSHTPTTAEQHM